ncbi:hypothetical protein YTPLAS18_03760 [Nitrospira sp.]|nr:hypothetical protein YTPLAS18_03760 [Nitrospira sp.]
MVRALKTFLRESRVKSTDKVRENWKQSDYYPLGVWGEQVLSVRVVRPAGIEPATCGFEG